MNSRLSMMWFQIDEITEQAIIVLFLKEFSSITTFVFIVWCQPAMDMLTELTAGTAVTVRIVQ